MRKITALAAIVLAVSAAKEVCAQHKHDPVLADLLVVRVADDTYRFSSRTLATPGNPSVECRFTAPILVLAGNFGKGGLVFVGLLGAVQADGSLLVGRSDFLGLLRIGGAVALLPTTCSGPGQVFSINLLQQILLKRIEPLKINESVTMKVVYNRAGSGPST